MVAMYCELTLGPAFARACPNKALWKACATVAEGFASLVGELLEAAVDCYEQVPAKAKITRLRAYRQ